MEISAQLLKPSIKKIETEWRNFYQELHKAGSEEAQAIKPSIEQKIQQLERLQASMMFGEQEGSALEEFPNLHEALRFLKLDLRTTQRKWRRHLVSRIRTQKRQARSVCAARSIL